MGETRAELEMFHGKHLDEQLQTAAGWAGISLGPDQLLTLAAYAEWLVTEAIPAGGLGPGEADRIVDRHLADSLVYGAGWGAPPATLVDVGSGVGLPGIPLAIAYPNTAVTLLDRSQRRTDLARRAVHILRLENTEAIQGDRRAHPIRYAAATFRASLPRADAIEAAGELLEPGGIAVIALHRGDEPALVPESRPDAEFQLLETPEGVLDSPAWLLRMTMS